MKQVFELKNISEETQLVLNEKGEKVEVEAGESFRTTEKSYLRNYAHIFAEVGTEKGEPTAPAPKAKGKKAKTTPQEPVDPENPEGETGEEGESESDPVDPKTEETEETEEEEEKKSGSEAEETA